MVFGFVGVFIGLAVGIAAGIWVRDVSPTQRNFLTCMPTLTFEVTLTVSLVHFNIFRVSSEKPSASD